jgi:hypothetical protein
MRCLLGTLIRGIEALTDSWSDSSADLPPNCFKAVMRPVKMNSLFKGEGRNSDESDASSHMRSVVVISLMSMFCRIVDVPRVSGFLQLLEKRFFYSLNPILDTSPEGQHYV